MANEVEIIVTATDKTKAGFGSVDQSASKASTGMRAVATAGKVATGVLIGAAAGAITFGKAAISEARESQKVTAQTEAVIKSTGGAANVTADQVGALSESISNKVAVDDEAIQSGANLLLTFKNIRNEAGKGNDIFNQATMTITDMSAALGTDMKSSAIMVGKALNDPIAGISALTRVGVTFTEKQKDKIESLVEEGKTMQAQKLILGELNSEFAGSAAAGADAGDKLTVAWNNLQETIGLKLMPHLTTFANKLSELIGWVDRNQTTTAVLLGTLVGLAAVVKVVSMVVTAWSTITKIATAAQWLWNAAMAANPIGLIIIAIAALAIGIVIAYKKSERFRAIVHGLWGILKRLGGWLKSNWKNILLVAFTGPLGIIILLVRKFGGKIRDFFAKALGWVRDKVKSGLSKVVGFFRDLPGKAADALQRLRSRLVDIIGNALSWLREKVSSGLSRVVGFFRDLPGKIGNALSSIPGKLGRVASAAVNKFMDVVRSIPGKVADALAGIWDSIPTPDLPDIPGVPGLAHGGIVGAAAAGGVRSNTTLVGERGPELVNLAPGSRVHPAGATRAMLNGGGGGATVIEIRSGGSKLDDMLVELLRKSIRVKGGNVQTVLGS